MSLVTKFMRDQRGQDILEYVIIVAFAVTAIAVLSALYSTIRQVLSNANTELQGIR